jgi:hypothetical protein
MDSAITAIRHTDGSSGILDGSAAEKLFDDDPLGGLCAGVGRGSSAVPSDSEASDASAGQSEPQSSQEKVVLPQLWFRLSEEDRACFGGCFSQMVLRVFGWQTDGAGGDEP